MEAAIKIPDEYERRILTYARIKALEVNAPQQPSVKEKIEENQKNPYHIPSGSAPTSSGVSFDVRSKEARELAYKRLKDAQRRPIGNKT